MHGGGWLGEMGRLGPHISTGSRRGRANLEGPQAIRQASLVPHPEHPNRCQDFGLSITCSLSHDGCPPLPHPRQEGESVRPLSPTAFTPVVDRCYRAQLPRPRQGAQQCDPEGAVLLPQADLILPALPNPRDKAPDPSWSLGPPRRFASRLFTRFLSSCNPAVELGLVIGTPGRDISQAEALNHIAGYSERSSRSITPTFSHTPQPSPST